MSPLAPLPPSIAHSTTRLTHAEAATQLSAFLTHADAHPAYRPDSTLSSTGPVSASSAAGGGGTNLTLAHLRRVLAGLQGRRVGGTLSLPGEEKNAGAEDGDEGGSGRPAKRARLEVEVEEDGEVAKEWRGGDEEGGAMTWQEKDDFELEQDELLEDVGEEQGAQPGVGANSGSGEVVDRPVEVVDVTEAAGINDGAKTHVDKEERKREKKERKAERKKKAAADKRKGA